MLLHKGIPVENNAGIFPVALDSGCYCESADMNDRQIDPLAQNVAIPAIAPDTAPELDADFSSLDDAAQKLKVCGHPVRLKLLCTIAKEEDPCVSELWICVNQPQPVVSQHLAVLKEKGIVRSEVHGNRRTYSIIDPFVAELIKSLDKK